MKGKVKLRKILSSGLAIIMASSTVTIPQNLVLASQLANIDIISDEDTENVAEEIPDGENIESSSDLILDDENIEGSSDLILDDENIESSSDLILDDENIESSSDLILDDENIESSSDLILDDENIESSSENQDNAKPVLLDENNIEKQNFEQSDLFILDENGVITQFNTGSVDVTNLVIPAQINGKVVTGIGDNVFTGRKIETVTFEEGSQVNSIGNYTFKNTPLTSITFPDTLTSIGNNAFENTWLTNVTIPSNITTMGSYAFANSPKLETVSIEDGNLKSINSYTFYSCTALTSVKIGEGVNYIGESAFAECSSLSKVEIPNSLTSIGTNTFKNCTNLVTLGLIDNTEENKVIIPSNLKEIGTEAFYYSGIKEVVFKEGIEKIPAYAFKYATVLTKVTVPSSLKTIEKEAFYYCSKLTTFGLAGHIEENVIIIPSNVTSIGQDSFTYVTAMTTLKIEGSKENPVDIGVQAFYRTSSLKTVEIGYAKNIGSDAFGAYSTNYNLTTVKIESAEYIAPYAFGYCENLTDVTINSVKKLDYSVFINSGLTEITIPGDITSIGTNCFGNSKVNITIEKNKLDSGITGGPWGSTGIVTWKDTYNKDDYIIDIDGYLQRYKGSETNVNIPEKVTNDEGTEIIVKEIGEYAFSGLDTIPMANPNNKNITSITIPNTITKIGQYAFKQCESLQNITIANDSQLENIDKCAFYECTSLGTINIPNSVTQIGDSAFYNCSSLTSVTIPDSVTSIGNNAFENCSSLASITIPNSVTQIGDSAFAHCTSLTSITIPDSVTSIGTYTFSYCENLSNVKLSEQLETIDSGLFSNCTNLKNIKIPASVTTIKNNALYGVGNVWIPDKDIDDISDSKWGAKVVYWKNTYPDTTGQFVIYVDKENETGRILAYIGDETKTNIDIPETLSYDESSIGGNTKTLGADKSVTIIAIDSSAFYENTKIISITLPETLKTIGQYAFYKCTNLENINLENIESIGQHAFYDCNKLETINIENLKTLGGYAFYDCDGLKEVTIPSGVTYLDYTFANCRGLETVNIPNGDESLSLSRAFMYCSKLKTVNINRGTNIDIEAFRYCNSLTDLNIGKADKPINIVGSYAFMGCKNLKNINIDEEGATVTLGGYQAFYNCDSLETLNIPSRVSNIKNEKGVVTTYGIGSYTFANCDKLKTINIAEGGEDLSIGIYAFSSSKISKINIPARVVEIGQKSFENCSNLSSVDIKGAPIISYSAFINCSNLINVDLGGTKEIRDSAFSGCINLEDVKIPDTVTSIGNEAFKNCEKLTLIEISANVTSIGNNAFLGCNSLDAIYVAQRRANSPFRNNIGWGAPNNIGKYFLGEYISTEHTKTERIDGENFNIVLDHNGYGLIILGVTDYLGYKQEYQNETERETVHKVTYDDLTKLLEDKVYTFLTHGQFTDSQTNKEIPTTYRKVVKLDGFVSYVDSVTKKHLTGVPVDKTQYELGDTITIPDEKPIGQGSFEGYTDIPGSAVAKYQPGETITMTAGNINLYAIFNNNKPTHTLTLVYGYDDRVEEYKLYEQEVTLSQITNNTQRNGYIFDNWYETQDFSGSPVTKVNLTKDTTLYAKYIPKKVEITYHDRNNVEKDIIDFDDVNYKLKKPSRSGYTFKGWFKDSDSGENINDSNLWDNVQDNGQKTLEIELYAKWSKKQETTTDSSGEDTSTETTTNSETTSVESSTEATTTSQTTSVESSTEATTTSQIQTTTNVEPSTEVTTTSQIQTTTNVESSTEATTNDNQIPPVIDGTNNGGNDGGGDTTQQPQEQLEVRNEPQNNSVYTFGNLEEITPEYEELARQAIANITPDREAINDSIDNMLENASNNGSQINERRLTEKPAFGFGAEGNISLLIILLLLLVLIVIGYIVKKQIFDKEKDKDEECEEDNNSSLTI